MAYTYKISLTKGEFDALAWLAGRYESAEKLYDLMHPPDDWDGETFPATFGLREFEAWQFQAALETEDVPGVIPCASGELQRKVNALVEQIV